MSIQELSRKLKGFMENTEYLLAGLIIVVALTSFYLGRLSITENTQEIQQKAQISEIQQKEGTQPSVPPVKNEEVQVTSDTAGYVASKSGTKYHLPWCGGAKQIKEENKIWFATKEEAEKAGYLPASNCKGI